MILVTVNPNNVLTEEEIRSFIFSGCLYEYISFDYKQAVADWSLTHTMTVYPPNLLFKIPPFYEISEELKEKYKVTRIGKLRNISFTPDGHICKMLIGNKRAKCFFQYNMGVDVKPIIHPMDDNLNLIERGFAVSSIKNI
jgi:hypothetical protein